MPKEIERKFRIIKPTEAMLSVINDPAFKSKQSFIEQAYIRIDPDGEFRIRRSKDAIHGERIVFTDKSKGGISRDEEEGTIKSHTGGFIESVFRRAIGKRIIKLRIPVRQGFVYKGKDHVCTIEVDEFSGHLAGLWIAEIEFPSEEAAAAFVFPKWFPEDRIEVTNDPRYKNAALAMADGPPELPVPSPVS